MSKQKVTFWIAEGELIKEKFKTDNQSEAIRLAIVQSLATEDLEKIKTLFPYIGKKPPRIGKEVVEALKQSECKIFVDLFCGSIAMLCYLACDVKVVINDINGEGGEADDVPGNYQLYSYQLKEVETDIDLEAIH